MSTTKEGSSRDAGDKRPVPGACGPCIVCTAAAVSQVFQIREIGRVPRVDSEAKASAMRRAKALPDCFCNLPCTAVGARLLWRLVTAHVPHKRHKQRRKPRRALCLSENGRGRGGPLRRSLRLLPWMEAVSVRHARGLVAFGLARLPRVCLWEQCIGDFHREVAHAQVVSEG